MARLTKKPKRGSGGRGTAIGPTAAAIQEGALILRDFGGYLERICGTVPEDLVGYFGGDRLKVLRADNILRILKRSKALNESRGVEPQPVSVAVSLPLLVAAADESRDELLEIWARLLAAAADPTRSKSFRQSFIAIAKSMDPYDALVLEALWSEFQVKAYPGPDTQRIQGMIRLSHDEIEVCRGNLSRLGLVAGIEYGHVISHTPLGREFMRAISDLPSLSPTA